MTTVTPVVQGFFDQYERSRSALDLDVQFVWRFEKASAPPIDVKVDSTFILHLNHGARRIVFQHEREDFQQALRASGVLPAKP